MTREEAIEYNKNLRMYMKISDKYQPCKFLKENHIAFDMAIRSLEAWEKVRKEIKSLKPYFCNMDNEVIFKSGEGIVQECIDIIDKHLSEVSE